MLDHRCYVRLVVYLGAFSSKVEFNCYFVATFLHFLTEAQ